MFNPNNLFGLTFYQIFTVYRCLGCDWTREFAKKCIRPIFSVLLRMAVFHQQTRKLLEQLGGETNDDVIINHLMLNRPNTKFCGLVFGDHFPQFAVYTWRSQCSSKTICLAFLFENSHYHGKVKVRKMSA